jgi:hypothetical protein
VADEPEPWVHFARGLEELLRGTVAALAWIRADLRQSDVAGLWEWGKRYALPALRDAIRVETHRWEVRAAQDAEAARVYEVFRTLLEILEPPVSRSPGKTRPGPTPRRPPERRAGPR